MSRRFRQLVSCLMIGAVICLQGCGKKENIPADQGNRAGTDEVLTQEEGNEDKEQAMGRYLEEEIMLPEEMTESNYPTMCLQKLDTGELALIEQKAGMYLSEDQGESWSRKEAPWLKELQMAYISHMAIAPNGAVAIIYSPPSEETEETSDEGFHPKYLYVDPDGNQTVLESPEENGSIHQFWFGKDSRLYGYTMDGRVYEMDPAGEAARQIFAAEGLSNYVCFTDQYMIDITSRGLLFYDMENEILSDGDRVLQDFIMENVGEDIGGNAGSYTVIMARSEQEDAVYFACSSGLYRHAIGGTAVEQIVEGSLSSMGDPMMSLAGIAVLPDNEFVILYTNGKMYRYVYDPNIPTVPEQQVSIYSLTENYAIRRAVSLFQKQHPESYVRYEIGMNTGSGMTSEDAIKNLNTRMMSGSGPDLLVLDGLPRHSYEEKGVLMELSEVVKSLSGENELFPNIVEACREDGKLWYLPIRFRLPLLAGDQKAMEKAVDLTTLADAVEELRSSNPQGALTGLYTEDKVLRTLGINCSGAWTDSKTGSIDQEKLTDFLRQARRIYQAEIAGIGEEELAERKVSYERSKNWSGALEYFATASSGGLNVAMKEQKLALGVAHMMDGDFNMISTLKNQEENFGYSVWQGQIQNGFIPKGMIGICPGSKESELALTFFRFLYGRELQDVEVPTGFPVNMASFEQLKENPREEDMGISIGTSGPDGESFHLNIQWITEEDFEELKHMVQSASAVCAGDAVIEEVVYEVGQKAVNGSVSPEDAAAEIVKKVAIYLAE